MRNPEAFGERLKTSRMWKRLVKERKSLLARYGPAEQEHAEAEIQRTCVTLDARMEELSGSVELNHSTYYTNDAVIRRVAAFLVRGVAAEATLE
jgi:hypothetical protein